MDPDGEVGAPTARVPRHDRRAPGQLPVGLGHERRGALVAGRHDADAGAFERVEQAEEGLAGHGEGIPDAGRPEGVGDEPADRPRAGVDDRFEVSGPEARLGTARWSSRERRPSVSGASARLASRVDGVSGGLGQLGRLGRRGFGCGCDGVDLGGRLVRRVRRRARS